ncbi:MAG TPA: sigma-70 family RNA polymerase sigma factor [Candidatus Saccharimonadales bacterium]|nr:sigma-70 family RNA polymerase sigma factor [Candidatus Saccharimonadales bacterium]
MKSKPDKLTSTRWSLIRRLQNADDHAGWQEFFESYWRLIYSTAVRSGLSDAEAQDAVQETIIAVCRNIRQLDMSPEAGSFKNWLMRMARWRIVDQIRRRRPESSLLLREQARGDTATDTLADPAGPELEKIWDEEWRSNLTEAALAKVRRQTSSRYFQIFYLYVVQGTPVQKVAAVTGASPDEVYLVKHRLGPLFTRALKAVEACQRS